MPTDPFQCPEPHAAPPKAQSAAAKAGTVKRTIMGYKIAGFPGVAQGDIAPQLSKRYIDRKIHISQFTVGLPQCSNLSLAAEF